jgi:hypothetical protein
MTNLDDAVSKVGAKRYSMLRRTPSVEKIILLRTALQAASWKLQFGANPVATAACCRTECDTIMF